jgi:hypothetical protein
VPTTESAVLVENNLFRGGSLVFGRRVVAALAALALEREDNSVSGGHEVLRGLKGWRL